MDPVNGLKPHPNPNSNHSLIHSPFHWLLNHLSPLQGSILRKFPVCCRGCLFYGPPGTGKTLVARALANECSQGERKVAFFMRKGADCLSKWVGESERQLRLLFDQVQYISSYNIVEIIHIIITGAFSFCETIESRICL